MKTKKCRACQEDIPQKAKICPKCHTKQRGVLKWVIVLLLLIVVFASSGTEEEAPILTNTNPVPEEKNVNTKYRLGDTVSYKNVAVTALNYTESKGGEFFQPADGNVYILVEFEIENNSDAEMTVSTLLHFTGYVDNYACVQDSSVIMFLAESDFSSLDTTIAQGKKARGVVGFEAPKDWGNLEVYYKNNFWNDSDFSFIIEK